MNEVRVAAIQMNTGNQLASNLQAAGRLLERAAGEGAVMAALPENFAFMGSHETDKLALAEADGDGPIQDFLAATAQRLGLWIVAGTVPLAVDRDPGRVHPACLVYDHLGQRAARYNKVHLFDVDLPRAGSTERYRESATILAGEPGTVLVDTPAGRLGLSVCYDLRFPELYRSLSAQGAELLCVPAAFTARTGEAHWDVLLRARAIENQCFVIAPAECGLNPGGRSTWGHSMVIDPWGEILSEQAAGEGIAIATLDFVRQRELRAGFPVLWHRRL